MPKIQTITTPFVLNISVNCYLVSYTDTIIGGDKAVDSIEITQLRRSETPMNLQRRGALASGGSGVIAAVCAEQGGRVPDVSRF